jgi:hypothetical protein
MSIADLKLALADIPGIEQLTMQSFIGRQLFGLNGLVIGTDAAASQDEIERAIRTAVTERRPAALSDQPDPPMTPLPANSLTQPLPRDMMLTSIMGFQPGSIQAMFEDLRQKAQARRAQTLQKVAAAASKHANVDAALERMADLIDREADAAMHEFAKFTNQPLDGAD